MNTLNSASLVNKGLELIETHLLFGIDYDRIDVVVHPQSIVHSMVTFTDGSTLAQASPPDMKLPIALALGWPSRVRRRRPGLRLHHGVDLGFRAAGRRGRSRPSTWRGKPGRGGGCLTAVYNAANEEAATAFLQARIRFPTIVRTIAAVLRAADQWAAEPATVEDVLDADCRGPRAAAGPP